MEEFLRAFWEPLDGFYVEFAAVVGEGFARKHFRSIDEGLAWISGFERDVYFAPALRREPSGKKEAFALSRAVWLDVDSDSPVLFLPPSIVVRSGSPGHRHLYWLLKEEVRDAGILRSLLKEMGKRLGGDAQSADVVRVLRLPNTVNGKNGVRAELAEFHPSLRYSLSDVRAALRVPSSVWKRVHSDDVEGYESRSERDMSIVGSLVRYGLSDEAIHNVFLYAPCGEKYRDERRRGNGENYISRTIAKAREEPGSGASLDGLGIVVRGKQVANFGLTPLAVVLEDEREGEGFLVRVRTPQRERELYVPPEAFQSVQAFLSHLAVLGETVWTGTLKDLQFVKARLAEAKERIHGVRYVGRWERGAHWILPDRVLSPDGWLDAPPVRLIDDTLASFFPLEYPTLDPEKDFLQSLISDLPLLNIPGVVLPVLGWYMATPYRQVLWDQGYRFPILNLWGTTGAGKTSTVNLFQRLFGYVRDENLDLVTTPFSRLARLSCSNGIPVHISEYRSNLPGGIHALVVRDLIVLYDGTVDTRGRPDLTLQQYRYRSPVVVTGEEPLQEPALIQRSIRVWLTPESLDPELEHMAAYHRLIRLPLQRFAGGYVLWTLRVDPPLRDAENVVYGVSEALRLPERVRRSLIVAVVGLLSFKNFLLARGLEPPELLEQDTIQTWVHNYATGIEELRFTAVDHFIEEIFYLHERGLLIHSRLEDGVFWFFFPSAYQTWSRHTSGSARAPVDRAALERQLWERRNTYTVQGVMDFSNRRRCEVWGVHLDKAREFGLRLPIFLEEE